MKLRPPSPAIVISIIALVLATTGSAVGASLITSGKIKNGTIRSADIKKDSILLNRLSKGTQRLIRRDSGGSSSSGSGVAYETVRKSGPENQPGNVLATVASMTVPAGAYVITANTIMTAFTGSTNPLEALIGANGSVSGTCILDAAGVTAASYQTIAVNDRQTPATLGMQLTRTVGAPSEIKLTCSGAIPWRASETSIIATKVDSINLTESGG